MSSTLVDVPVKTSADLGKSDYESLSAQFPGSPIVGIAPTLDDGIITDIFSKLVMGDLTSSTEEDGIKPPDLDGAQSYWGFSSPPRRDYTGVSQKLSPPQYDISGLANLGPLNSFIPNPEIPADLNFTSAPTPSDQVIMSPEEILASRGSAPGSGLGTLLSPAQAAENLRYYSPWNNKTSAVKKYAMGSSLSEALDPGPFIDPLAGKDFTQ